MASFEIVVLEQFLVLKMTVLGLYGVELVTQSLIVFVTLLNFEDFGFELTDKQVFLI